MGSKWMVILLLEVIFIGASYGVVGGDPISEKKLVDVERKINLHKRHAVKSIKSEDGDIIDCVDIYKQPAFDHPALKYHTIQMTPTFDPTMKESSNSTENSSVSVISQLWQKRGRCPKGTIPIRRARKEVLLKADSIENYGRKKMSFYHKVQQLNGSKTPYPDHIKHSSSILITSGYSYLGAKGDFRVWKPFVEFDEEYSTSSISLKNGAYDDFESVESGWAVLPGVYGDRETRLYAYWTTDASKSKGCFDLTCPGFVQTSSEIALGAAGLPYQITLYINKDPKTNNWWLQYGEKINIGYWPSNIFQRITHTAETVQWGGEVYSPRVYTTPHTSTDMGSGEYADSESRAGWVKRIRILDNSMVLKFPEWVNPHSDEYDCYSHYLLKEYIPDPEFYYGGPGRNERCP